MTSLEILSFNPRELNINLYDRAIFTNQRNWKISANNRKRQSPFLIVSDIDCTSVKFVTTKNTVRDKIAKKMNLRMGLIILENEKGFEVYISSLPARPPPGEIAMILFPRMLLAI